MTTNMEVLDKLQKECEIISTIKKRKIEYLRHIMREPQYVSLNDSARDDQKKEERR